MLVMVVDHAKQAERIADFLVTHGPALEGVLLYGSVARGSATEWSDIDLLVVGPRTDVRVSELLRKVRKNFPHDRVSLVYLATDQVEEYLSRGSRFLIHIRREGRILHDGSGILTAALSRPFEPIPATEEIDLELERLQMYDDLSRYGDNYLFCLSHIYTLAKTIVMARLAEAGFYEFDRTRAFTAFGERWPEAKPALATIQELQPFYNLVSRRHPQPLPFSFKGTGDKVAAAVEAARDIASASEVELV